jgi:hypothetical protein
MELTVPDPVVPTPAAQFGELRGRRVLIGIPGVGFRADLRADDAVIQGSRTFVPVLTEQDYYRAEMEQIEVFAPLVPIDRVWVEDVRPAAWVRSAALDAPALRRPQAARTVLGLTGRRLIHQVADGFVRDLRALSELFSTSAGEECVRVCVESEWYAWALTGSIPESMDLVVASLWAE